MKHSFTLVLIFVCIQFNFLAQSNSEINIQDIMSGDSFIGHQPYDFKWSVDGSSIYYSLDTDTTDYPQFYEYDLKSKQTSNIPLDQRKKLIYYQKENKFKSQNFYLIDHQLIYLEPNSKLPITVVDSKVRKSELQMVENGQRVYFRQNNNLYFYDYEKRRLKQVTNFVNMNEPEEKEVNHYTKEESILFDQYKNEAKLHSLPKKKELTINLKNKSLNSIQISPNEKYIIYRTSEKPKIAYTKVPHYINRDGYVKTEYARPKVGTKQTSSTQLSIYVISNDTILALDFSSLSGIRNRPEYQKEYGITGALEKDKDLIIHEVDFSKSGDFALISIKSQDNKDRWLVIYDFTTKKMKEIEHQHDEAWIGGPGISGWNFIKGNMGWLNNDHQVYFQSEISGYSHLYLYDRISNKTTALTTGNYEIHNVEISRSGKHFYITANKIHPGNREYYKLEISTRELTPILIQNGRHEVRLSPDEKWMAVRFSYSNKPWELYIGKVHGKTELNQITTSTKDSFKNIDWIEPQIVTLQSTDGNEIYARLYKPEKSLGNKAAIIFVHGAGYLQNAHNWWSSYHREYMFHNLLVKKGYTVLDIDYRASEGYGKSHRTDIYRNMGGKDLSDNIDGRNYLIEEHGIDQSKIGIYGGSYGGFITLMALFKHPGKFTCGGALRSVTDWSHYNHEYTSNILNTPESDSIAYRRSSPIYYANGLQDRLILFHGMLDDNVQYQDIIRLNQRFIELGKINWNLVSYPFEKHGFKTTSSWIDEYSRLLKMFDEELLDK